jgi:hypothetical protein
MPNLQLRNIPTTIYEKLIQQAKKEHKSLSQQAIVELAKALNISLSPKDRRAQVIRSINEFHKHFSFQPKSDPVEVIHMDRDR